MYSYISVHCNYQFHMSISILMACFSLFSRGNASRVLCISGGRAELAAWEKHSIVLVLFCQFLEMTWHDPTWVNSKCWLIGQFAGNIHSLMVQIHGFQRQNFRKISRLVLQWRVPTSGTLLSWLLMAATWIHWNHWVDLCANEGSLWHPQTTSKVSCRMFVDMVLDALISSRLEQVSMLLHAIAGKCYDPWHRIWWRLLDREPA